MTDLKLREMYQKWIQQVEECSETKSLLGKSFSNPYYISTPKEWHQAKNKILIVGQEGHGEFGSGKTVGWHYKKDINRIQEYNQKIHFYFLVEYLVCVYKSLLCYNCIHMDRLIQKTSHIYQHPYYPFSFLNSLLVFLPSQGIVLIDSPHAA